MYGEKTQVSRETKANRIIISLEFGEQRCKIDKKLHNS